MFNLKGREVQFKKWLTGGENLYGTLVVSANVGTFVTVDTSNLKVINREGYQEIHIGTSMLNNTSKDVIMGSSVQSLIEATLENAPKHLLEIGRGVVESVGISERYETLSDADIEDVDLYDFDDDVEDDVEDVMEFEEDEDELEFEEDEDELEFEEDEEDEYFEDDYDI